MWLLGFISASSGILIGGTIAWLFKGLQHKVDIIYGLCAGIILGLISLEILPESVELGGWFKTFVGFIIGIILFKVLHNALHHNEAINDSSKEKMYIRTGLLLMLSISIHNVPMGMVLATSQESNLTTVLLQTLLFHSIPEGIILFTPLILANINLLVGLFFTFIVSISIPLGVVLGGYFGVDHQSISAIFISITLGIIFMVTVSEILYPALIKSSLVKVLLCTLIGIAVITIYLKIV